MTEEEARAWVRARHGVSRETLLARFADLLIAENERQNLIARSTIPMIWSRHLADSAQLVALAEGRDGQWIDIGSGGGLPGLVIAILRDAPVLLVEPRARRAGFLASCVAALGLRHCRVEQAMVERIKSPSASVISARAVAPLDALFGSAVHCASRSTLWLLPKGATAHSEVEAAARAWQGMFHVEPSITHRDSGIVIARDVRRR